MKPVRTLYSNHNFGPPPGHEGVIDDLPCQIVEEPGFKEIRSVWELSQQDRDAIANGCNLVLGIGWIGAFPPVSLGVAHVPGLIDFTPEDVIGG